MAKGAEELAFDILLEHLGRESKGSDPERLRSVAAGAVRALLRGGIILKKKGRIRTMKQNNFLHLAFDHFARESGMDPEDVKEGILEQYGYRVRNEFTGELRVKRTHEYLVDEIDVLLTGLTAEGAEQDPPVDMSEFWGHYERMKQHEQQRTDTRDAADRRRAS